MRKEKEFVVKKERMFSFSFDMFILIKLIAFIVFCIFFCWILAEKHLEIYLHREKDANESYLFTILVSIMLVSFMIACGFVVEIKKSKYKLVFLFAILVIIIFGFTQVGLGLIFNTNFGLLYYEIYESNSFRGIRFFTDNFYFWTLIWIVSFLFEKEKE